VATCATTRRSSSASPRVFNHDHGTNYLAGLAVTPPLRADFERVFAPIRALDPERPFEIAEVDGLVPGPSDHAPFVRAEVPAFFWQQGPEGYRRIHHTQHDVFEAANHADQEHSALVVALAALGVANLDHQLDRTDLLLPGERKMGVLLEGTQVTRVMNGRARDAGWQVGDVIVSIDGTAVETRRAVVSELQRGGPRKEVRLRRGEELIESELDYSDDPEEPRRARLRKRQAAREQAAPDPAQG